MPSFPPQSPASSQSSISSFRSPAPHRGSLQWESKGWGSAAAVDDTRSSPPQRWTQARFLCDGDQGAGRSIPAASSCLLRDPTPFSPVLIPEHLAADFLRDDNHGLHREIGRPGKARRRRA